MKGKGKWVSLPNIAQGLEVSQSTARRWANAFADILTWRGAGASRTYLEPDTTQVLVHARELFETGKNTAEVARILRRRFPATIDGEAEGSPSPSPSHVPTTTTEAAGRAHLAAAMRSLVEHVAELQQTVAELSATIEAADRRHEAQIADINAAHRAELAELRDMIEARLPQAGEDAQTAAGGIVARLRALFPLGRGPGQGNKQKKK